MIKIEAAFKAPQFDYLILLVTQGPLKFQITRINCLDYFNNYVHMHFLELSRLPVLFLIWSSNALCGSYIANKVVISGAVWLSTHAVPTLQKVAFSIPVCQQNYHLIFLVHIPSKDPVFFVMILP